MSPSCTVDCTREIFERSVIDFERNRIDVVRGITERHFSRVSEQTKSCYVGDGVNWILYSRIIFEFLKRE